MVEDAGHRAVLVPGDIGDPAHARGVVDMAVEAFGRVDVLVNNAAHQQTFAEIEDIPDEKWNKTLAVNMHAMFYLCKAAVPRTREGSSIINATSVNADKPLPTLLAYATAKARSTMSPPGWRRCWLPAGSASTRSRRGRCGRR